eukprot:868412-Amphidinium_carterae.1
MHRWHHTARDERLVSRQVVDEDNHDNALAMVLVHRHRQSSKASPLAQLQSVESVADLPHIGGGKPSPFVTVEFNGDLLRSFEQTSQWQKSRQTQLAVREAPQSTFKPHCDWDGRSVQDPTEDY